VKILIVDDERSIVEMMVTVLRKEGFSHIDTAFDGESALLACEQKRYDIVLLDIMMPGESGLDICPFIRRTTDAPILFITAKTSDFDILSGFAVGGDDYIAKPFNPLEVVARMRAQLRRYL
ncbi:DNA-binding response regulator, partial [Pseudomonas sp. FW305-BF6]|uniref:response regulator transcription factor n=1 Tax=Pseudomonas sp. FW305-BF6 TaxID=2070673 RepID=UPI000CB79F9B